MKPMQTETLSLRITEAESRALRERAVRDGVSQGSVVRRALRAYGVVPEPAGESFHDRIRPYIGMYKGGLPDLSTNPDYFKDFGR
jgi:hypothetical protein